MKKMTYLMMLALGLTAVQTDANFIQRAKKKVEEVKTNTKKFVSDVKKSNNLREFGHAVVSNAKSAIENNKDIIKTVAAA